MSGTALLTFLPAAHAATLRRAAVGTHFATIAPACQAPAPGYASCYALRRVAAKASTPGAIASVVQSSYPVGPDGYGYTPSDLWSAYNLGTQASLTATDGPGTGQTVGIVDAYDDPDIDSDLQTFDTEYGLPTCDTQNGCFTKVGQTGSTTSLPASVGTSGWDQEISLDVETVRAVCPDCKILLVEADSDADNNLGAAVDKAVNLGATEVSNSYGGPEGTSAADDASFESDYEHPGVVVTASAGDQGYFNWVSRTVSGETAEDPEANIPAAFPQTVAVGGTSLTLNSDGTRDNETVWNDSQAELDEGYGGASGGGCSTLFTVPSWQSTEPGYLTAGCDNHRLVSDISADGDPNTGIDIYDSYVPPGGKASDWETVGGTSLSSPLIAAMYALAGGAQGVADPAQTLYGQPAGTFYDVTSGGNGYCDGSYPCTPAASDDDCGLADPACNAGIGFDGPSGLGTPQGISDFVPSDILHTTTTGVACSLASGAVGSATTCTATVTDKAGNESTPPTGSVEFTSAKSGSFSDSGSCTLVPEVLELATNVSSCELTFTPSAAGSYTVTGTYGGDSLHGSSSGTSSSADAVAAPHGTATSVSCSPSSGRVGSATSCTVLVTDTASSGASTPTGTVAFSSTAGGSFADGGDCTLTGTGTSGLARCTDKFTPNKTGATTIAARYSGNSTHLASSGQTRFTGTASASTAKVGTASLGHTGTSGTAATVAVKCKAGHSCAVKLELSVVETIKDGKVVSVSAATARSAATRTTRTTRAARTARTTHKTVIVGTKSVKLSAGKTDKVKLALDKAGRKLLEKHSPMKVRVTVKTSSGTSVGTATVTFKAAKKSTRQSPRP